MNRLLCALSSFVVPIVFGLAGAGADELIEVLSPSDMVAVDGKQINLVYRVKKDFFDEVRVESAENTVKTLPEPVVSHSVRHDGLFLSEGKNSIRIQGVKGGKVVAEKQLFVYLRSGSSKKHGVAPPGFGEYTFHAPENERACAICHREELGENARSRQNPAYPACYTCHKRLLRYKFVHGPAAVWACATCHSKNNGKSGQAVPDPEVAVCQPCHEAGVTAWRAESYGHGPARAGRCAICHNPHASDEGYFLNKATSDLCAYCHASKLLEPHVIMRPSGLGHPVKQDQGEKGERPISCASCHNPHAENNKELLRGYTGSLHVFCANCHKR